MADAGWYPDPDVPGGRRYWDGTSWTEHRLSPPPPPPLFPVPPGHSTGPPPATDAGSARPWYRHPLAVAGALLVCFPVGLVLVWTSRWSTNVKIGLTAAIVVLVGVSVVADPSDPEEVTTTNGLADLPAVTSPSTVETSATTAEIVTSAAPTTAAPTLPPTTIDFDVMCKAALGDPDDGAAFNACTPEQFDRLQPSLAPGRPSRVAACRAATRGPACEGITPTTSTPPTIPRTAPPATVAPATEPPAPTARRYENCTALRADYPHGVGRPGAVDSVTSGEPVTNFTVDASVYAANTGSDRDKDGVACEQ